MVAFASNWNVFSALQDAFNIINNLKEDNISVAEMRFDLTKMGVSLSEQEFQNVLKRAGVTGESLYILLRALGYFEKQATMTLLCVFPASHSEFCIGFSFVCVCIDRVLVCAHM